MNEHHGYGYKSAIALVKLLFTPPPSLSVSLSFHCPPSSLALWMCSLSLSQTLCLQSHGCSEVTISVIYSFFFISTLPLVIWDLWLVDEERGGGHTCICTQSWTHSATTWCGWQAWAAVGCVTISVTTSALQEGETFAFSCAMYVYEGDLLLFQQFLAHSSALTRTATDSFLTLRHRKIVQRQKKLTKFQNSRFTFTSYQCWDYS